MADRTGLPVTVYTTLLRRIYELTKVLFTVMIEKDLPFYAAFQLFTNRTAFAEAVNDLLDPLIKALRADLSNLSQSEWSRQIMPTVNKLFRIVPSKATQRLMCAQKEGYNLELTFKETNLLFFFLKLSNICPLHAYINTSPAAHWQASMGARPTAGSRTSSCPTLVLEQ